MWSTVQSQPRSATEKTALIKSPTSTSLSSSIHSESSLSELNIISSVLQFRISRYKKRACCNFRRTYHVTDPQNHELLLTGSQDNYCWTNDFENLVVNDLQDQLMFTIEYEEKTGYLSTQMKFSIVSSAKIGMGSVSRIWSFMESPRFEIQNWDGEHLFSIGPPKITGIKSYDYKRKYEVVSNDGRVVATLGQVLRTVSLEFSSTELLQLRDKALILAFGFILDLLRNEEI